MSFLESFVFFSGSFGSRLYLDYVLLWLVRLVSCLTCAISRRACLVPRRCHVLPTFYLSLPSSLSPCLPPDAGRVGERRAAADRAAGRSPRRSGAVAAQSRGAAVGAAPGPARPINWPLYSAPAAGGRGPATLAGTLSPRPPAPAPAPVPAAPAAAPAVLTAGTAPAAGAAAAERAEVEIGVPMAAD